MSVLKLVEILNILFDYHGPFATRSLQLCFGFRHQVERRHFAPLFSANYQAHRGDQRLENASLYRFEFT